MSQPSAETTRDLRPWYKKKRFLIPIAVFVVLSLIGSLTDSSEETPTSQSESVQSESVQSESGTSNQGSSASQSDDGTEVQSSPQSQSSNDSDSDSDSQPATESDPLPSASEDAVVGDSETDSNQSQPDSEQDTAPESPANSTPVDTAPAAAETVASFLNLLRVAPEVEDGYDRDLFRHWVDDDRDGCDARREVLIAESLTQVRVGSGCSLSGGSWYSAFDGIRTTDPGTFDVDHMVPLKEAWDSGANSWSQSRREDFANDLGSPHSLIAVSSGSNRSKGADDPAEWMPPNSNYTCEYVYSWALVKIRWSLTVDAAELRALQRYADGCLVSELSYGPNGGVAIVEPEPEPTPAPTPEPDDQLDPQFGSCKAAIEAGYGPYVRGQDPEYEWYTDGDSDGTVCE